ncbi:hypothetical protein IQ06DRAFT_291626 [Phaeosphaeriaceae sp. SRC1lsM3a]|nr:hypothetical protein IQ06DRAFT_291626 [Stagonospora sp. SRC1lsM3a]
MTRSNAETCDPETSSSCLFARSAYARRLHRFSLIVCSGIVSMAGSSGARTPEDSPLAPTKQYYAPGVSWLA